MSVHWLSCRTWRQAAALRAAHCLPGPEAAALENHLAGCSACREHAAQLASNAHALRVWRSSLADLEPPPDAAARWARALETTGDPPAPVGLSRRPAAHGGWPPAPAWPVMFLSPRGATLAVLALIWLTAGAIRGVTPGLTAVEARGTSPSPTEIRRVLREILADGAPNRGPLPADRPTQEGRS
jgi:anti-sigma factor RsiW